MLVKYPSLDKEIRTLCSNRDARDGSIEAFPPKKGALWAGSEAFGFSDCDLVFLPMLTLFGYQTGVKQIKNWSIQIIFLAETGRWLGICIT